MKSSGREIQLNGQVYSKTKTANTVLSWGKYLKALHPLLSMMAFGIMIV